MWLTTTRTPRSTIDRVPTFRHRPFRSEPSASITDAFLESYVWWREACEDVRGAYGRWAASDQAVRDLAFATYRAALDSEEHAARVYSGCVERLGAAA